jgi:glycosyltransferase involved in cell wall biosynthesis
MPSSTDPIRVTHVIAPVPAGGAETVVRGLVRAGADHGFEARVAALLQTPDRSPFVERLRADGVTVDEIRCGRRQYLAEARALGHLLDASSAEVLHTHVYHGDMAGFLAGRGRRIPRVATVHGFTGGDWKNRFYQWVDQQLLKRFDGVMAVSETVRAQLLAAGVPAARVHLVPNAYQPMQVHTRAEARSRLGIDAVRPVAGWVGRLSPEKGPDLFAAALAQQSASAVTGVMLGDGAARAELESQRARLGISDDRLRLPGGRDDAAALMPAFDVMVLSSRTEGTPMALLEAMSAGVPVVAFAVGGIPQVLDRDSGWLVAPEDAASLANAIAEVLSTPDEARRRAARAREIVAAKFGVAQWMERIGQVYRAAGVR